MSAVAMSNRLPVLSAAIAQAHADALEHSAKAAERSIDAGKALVEAKGLCAHGTWLPFLKQAGIPERTAQRYMVLAASNLQSDTVSLLGGITAALKFIRLRETAHRHLCNAYDAAEALTRGEDADELTPLEWAIHSMGEMIEMFPPYEPARAP